MNSKDLNLNFFEYEEIGFHGHEKEVINNVIQKDKFSFSKKRDNYLGDGVYFFENDLSLTIRWCKRARRYTHWGILKAKIQTNKLINLDNNNHFDKVDSFFKKVIKKYEKIDGSRFLTSRYLYNMLYNVRKYEVIRCTLEVPYGGKLYFAPPVRNQVIVCVREHCCISGIEEVDVSGHQ